MEMKADKYIELMNKEISGEITAGERDDLHRYLREKPDARKLYRELRKTSDLLAGAGDIEPPAHLKHRIMNSVDFSRYRRKETRPVLEFARRVRRLSIRPRFAYAFATGVVVGLILYSVFLTGALERHSPDLRDLYATIGVTRDVSFRTIERVPLDLPEAEGSVALMRSADLLIFEVSLNSTQPFEVHLGYDPTEVRFNGLRPVTGGRMLSEVGEGHIAVSASGHGRFQISLTKTTESALPVDLKLLVSGEVLVSHRFEIEPDQEQQQ